MKHFQFLLLDAGPIMKLFELGIWDSFIKHCDVTISQTVANEAKYASQEFLDILIDIELYKEKGFIKIVDLDPSIVKTFYNKFDLQYKAIIHDGEKETLAFLCICSDDYRLCAADGAVFRVLGLLGKADKGISLEEILTQIGMWKKLEWQYTKKFREKYTLLGQADSIQDKGLRG